MIPANASSTPSPLAARSDVALDEARIADGACAAHVDRKLEAAKSQGLRHSVAGLKSPPGRLSAGQLCETKVRPRPNRRESFKCPARHRMLDYGFRRRREDHVGPGELQGARFGRPRGNPEATQCAARSGPGPE